MKKFILFCCCLLSSVNNAIINSEYSNFVYKDVPDIQSLVPENSYVVDEVLVVIYGPERTRIITQLEVERLSIDGRKRTLDDLIIEELIYQEGIKYKIQIDESFVDRYIANISKQYDVKEIFNRSGYTYEEGRKQLRMMYVTNAMINNIITLRLHVSREDVLEYYKKHPVIKEAQYKLQMALILLENNKTHEEQKQEILEKIKKGKIDTFVWYDHSPLKESEIVQHMGFIKDMKIGNVSTPVEVTYGFEVYRLVEYVPQRTKPLKKRYKEIEDILRQPQFQEKFEEYKKSLYEFATIVYYTKDKNHINEVLS